MATMKPLVMLFIASASFMPVAAQAMTTDRCNQIVQTICQGLDFGACFGSDSSWSRVPDMCVGDVQTMIEMEREAWEERNYGGKSGDKSGAGGDMHDGGVDMDTSWGMSWGGRLRDGPGMQYRQTGSVREYEWIEIIGPTDEWYDGYMWYDVFAEDGYGYLWGGLFCHEDGGYMEGTLGPCN